jgi:hypothetical protein
MIETPSFNIVTKGRTRNLAFLTSQPTNKMSPTWQDVLAVGDRREEG